MSDSNTRILDGTFIQTDDNSVSFCLARCAGLDYAFAGLENGNQCWCGAAPKSGNGLGSVRPSTACRTPCAANASQTCGGGDYGLSLWQDLNQVPIAFDPADGSDWQDSLYCLRDSATRTLAGFSTSAAFMTPQYCQCKSHACPKSLAAHTPPLTRLMRQSPSFS